MSFLTLFPFQLHTAVSQYWAELGRNLADSYILPFDVVAYGTAIGEYVKKVEDSFGDLIRANGLETNLGKCNGLCSFDFDNYAC